MVENIHYYNRLIQNNQMRHPRNSLIAVARSFDILSKNLTGKYFSTMSFNTYSVKPFVENKLPEILRPFLAKGFVHGTVKAFHHREFRKERFAKYKKVIFLPEDLEKIYNYSGWQEKQALKAKERQQKPLVSKNEEAPRQNFRKRNTHREERTAQQVYEKHLDRNRNSREVGRKRKGDRDRGSRARDPRDFEDDDDDDLWEPHTNRTHNKKGKKR